MYTHMPWSSLVTFHMCLSHYLVMPRVWIPFVGQARNAPYCQALRSMGLGTQSYPAGHKVQPRQPRVPRRRPAYLSTHTLPFFSSKSIVRLLSSEAVWRSLLSGTLSEWHFLHKQEELVWSPPKCAGVDRGCESVEANYCSRHPAPCSFPPQGRRLVAEPGLPAWETS